MTEKPFLNVVGPDGVRPAGGDSFGQIASADIVVVQLDGPVFALSFGMLCYHALPALWALEKSGQRIVPLNQLPSRAGPLLLDILYPIPKVNRYDRRMQSLHPADGNRSVHFETFLYVISNVADVVPVQQNVSYCIEVKQSAFLGAVSLSIQEVGDGLVAVVTGGVKLEDATDEIRFLGHDLNAAVSGFRVTNPSVSEHVVAAVPFTLFGSLYGSKADVFRDLFTLQLRGGSHHLNREPAERRLCLELLGQADQRNVVGIQLLNDVQQVRKGAGEAAELPDNDVLEVAEPGILQHHLQMNPPVDGLARHTRVNVDFMNA